MNTGSETKPSYKDEPRDLPEKGITKLCIYYADWCHYSKQIMHNKNKEGITIYQALKLVFNDDPNIEILAFKASEDSEVQSSNITGYPTLRLIKYDKIIELNELRSVDDISKFIKQYGYGG
jgi:hypothetical protein